MSDEAHFPARLLALRERAGLTQQQLADRASIGRVHVAQLEAGNRYPKWDTVCRLADALGIKTDDFRKSSE